MNDFIRRFGYQEWLHYQACHSNVQPAMDAHAGLTVAEIDHYFAAPTALAYMGLRKEGDHYVRN